MSRSSRGSGASPHTVSRWLLVSLLLSILLAIAFIVFAYQVSPLRDPAFQPNSANGGTLIPSLQWITEGLWANGAAALAAMLTTTLMLVFWQWSKPQRLRLIARLARLRSGLPVATDRLLIFSFWLMLSLTVFGLLWITFVRFLLGQWLID